MSDAGATRLFEFVGRLKPIVSASALRVSRRPDTIHSLGLWLSADAVRGRAAVAPLMTFHRSGTGTLPELEPTVLNGRGALHFTPLSSSLESAPLVGSEFLSERQATIFFVIAQDADEGLSNVFGWNKNSLFFSFLNGKQFIFESAGVGVFDELPSKNWEGRAHLLTLIRSGKTAEVYIDGFRYGKEDDVNPSIDTSKREPFILGRGYNAKGFSGIIGDLIIFREALPPLELGGVTRYLADKYSIKIEIER